MEAMIYIALVHFPVVNRRGEEIVSAVTNLDIHDIARAAITYGVKGYYVVTPVEGQKRLAGELVDHWLKGAGGELNPDRRDALGLVRVAASIKEAMESIRVETGREPVVYATTGREIPGAIPWRRIRGMLKEDKEVILLLFGTASGLAPRVIEGADGVIEPIKGTAEYRHLSVRTAAAVVLDRLTGEGRG